MPRCATRLVFDSRPVLAWHAVGRHARSLLEALCASSRGEIIESRDPRRGDVFHSPWIEGAPLGSPVPSVVTLHDLIPLKRPGDYLRTGLRFKLRYLAVQRATRVIVPTRVVADDAIRALGIPAERIVVIPEAPATAFWRRPDEEVAAVRRRHGLPDRYLLWAGSLRTPDPRKRVAALARASRSLPLPSDEEGFGLPPVEALACGTPVAACGVPALREVLAGRITLCDIDDLDGLLRRAEALSRPAPAPPPWTCDDVAAATWEVYEQALRTRVRARRRIARTPVVQAEPSASAAPE